MGGVTIICGIPNSGKTTFSARFNNVYHYDDMVRQGIKLEDIINQNNAVIEGLFETANARKRITNGTKNHCTLIWLDTPVEECLRRENRNRPTHMIRHHAKVFQPPTYEEGWDEIIRIRS